MRGLVSVPFEQGHQLLPIRRSHAAGGLDSFSPLRTGASVTSVNCGVAAVMRPLFQSPSNRGISYFQKSHFRLSLSDRVSVPFEQGHQLLHVTESGGNKVLQSFSPLRTGASVTSPYVGPGAFFDPWFQSPSNRGISYFD